jgi:hypothetical protein
MFIIETILPLQSRKDNGFANKNIYILIMQTKIFYYVILKIIVYSGKYIIIFFYYIMLVSCSSYTIRYDFNSRDMLCMRHI